MAASKKQKKAIHKKSASKKKGKALLTKRLRRS